MTNNNDPPPKQLFTILFFLGVLFFPIQVDKAANKPVEQQELYLRADCPVSPKNSVAMASLDSGDDLFAGLIYQTLIKCLAFHESGYNQGAIGDHGAAIGILQFHQPTFDAYCSGSIYSAEDQISCCEKMLLADFNNLKHWTMARFCLTNLTN